jgi:hypothetical protein
MSHSNRRIFLLHMAVAGTALAATRAEAQAAKLDEKDPQAVGLGYMADASKVDAKKYPQAGKDKKCSGCALFQGKAGEAWGPCGIFPGKQVNANGWCSAWQKKAA